VLPASLLLKKLTVCGKAVIITDPTYPLKNYLRLASLILGSGFTLILFYRSLLFFKVYWSRFSAAKQLLWLFYFHTGPLIRRVTSIAGYAEEYGTGTLRMIEEMKKAFKMQALLWRDLFRLARLPQSSITTNDSCKNQLELVTCGCLRLRSASGRGFWRRGKERRIRRMDGLFWSWYCLNRLANSIRRESLISLCRGTDADLLVCRVVIKRMFAAFPVEVTPVRLEVRNELPSFHLAMANSFTSNLYTERPLSASSFSLNSRLASKTSSIASMRFSWPLQVSFPG